MQSSVAIDDDEEYQPDEGNALLTSNISNTALTAPPQAAALGPYVIPQPSPLSNDEVVACKCGQFQHLTPH